MPRALDDLDARLLNLIQEEIPLVDRPFAALAEKLGLAEADVIKRIAALKSGASPVIRQISAIFDTRSLGYRSCLVAAKVEEPQIEKAARRINEHPGVTHNYLRNHPYNLWYTIAVPPDSRLGLDKTVDILHQRSGALVTRMLPALKLYKIGVSLDLSGAADLTPRSSPPKFTEDHRHKAMEFAVTDADKRMIRVLQRDLPVTERPFDRWAREADIALDDLLRAAKAYLEEKRMRRFSAVLYHREVGVTANAMGVWAVPPHQQDEFGAIAAGFQAVTHCYLRPTYDDWPYSIFTMVHGTQEKECSALFSAISQATGVRQYLAVYSSREFKKTRLQYFVGDIEAWEAAAVSAAH